MTTFRIRTILLAATAAGSLILTACGSSSTPAAAPATSATTMASSTMATTAAATTAAMSGASSMAPGMPMPSAPAGPHNAADITFASQMLVHHKGAVAMADLAPERAASAEVKALAVKIKAEQTPEIATMTGWLNVWQPATDMNGKPMTSSSMAMGSMGGMDHGSTTAAAMPGMMTDQQMAQLTAAKGADFDKMFLTLMIAHHRGAVEMAKTEMAGGSNPAALALADSIISSQTAEISAMQKMLATL